MIDNEHNSTRYLHSVAPIVPSNAYLRAVPGVACCGVLAEPAYLAGGQRGAEVKRI